MIMNEKPKSPLRWRLLRWGLVGLAVLVTLAGILVTEENWRGKRAWESYKQAAAARGERLDLASVIPPPVPDEQNFFAAPIVAGAMQWKPKPNSEEWEDPAANPTNRMNFNIYRGDSENWPQHGGSWQQGRLTDLKQWQTYFRMFNATPEGRTNGFPETALPQSPAADILLALSIFDPAVEELRQAAARPYARMPINYEDGFEAAGKLLPWLANTKRCGQFLQLRILAELEAGQGDKALDDVKLYLRLTDSLNNPRFLISQLVRLAMLSIVLEPVYGGITRHSWSEAQLAELEGELSREDVLAAFASAMNGEKVCAIDAFEKQRLTREIKTMEEVSGTVKVVTIKLRWVPAAYFYQNQLALVRMHQELIRPLVDFTNRIVAPAALRQAQATVQARMKHYSPYKVEAMMIFPALAASVTKFAILQAQVDLARTACALERFRLAHGSFPETLDALAPQYIPVLPHDLINGQPLHYRRTDDGKFVLYSVGWNEQDDGGKVVLTKGGTVDNKKGDWVWQYPAK